MYYCNVKKMDSQDPNMVWSDLPNAWESQNDIGGWTTHIYIYIYISFSLLLFLKPIHVFTYLYIHLYIIRLSWFKTGNFVT